MSTQGPQCSKKLNQAGASYLQTLICPHPTLLLSLPCLCQISPLASCASSPDRQSVSKPGSHTQLCTVPWQLLPHASLQVMNLGAFDCASEPPAGKYILKSFHCVTLSSIPPHFGIGAVSSCILPLPHYRPVQLETVSLFCRAEILQHYSARPVQPKHPKQIPQADPLPPGLLTLK